MLFLEQWYGNTEGATERSFWGLFLALLVEFIGVMG